MDMTGKTISTSHGDINVVDSGGTGFPVLFLHGSSSSHAVFARQFADPAFAGYRLIGFDLPGHGASGDATAPQKTYTIPGFAACTAELIEALGLEQAVVVGWSLGGHIAIELLNLTDRIAGVMICGAPPIPRGILGMLRGFHPSFDLLLTSKLTFTDRDVERFEQLCLGSLGTPGVAETIRRADGRARALVAQAMSRGDGADQRKTVENTAVPLAFVNGSDDRFVRPGYFEGLRVPLLFDGEQHVVEGVGHAPFWERPDVFNPLLRRFLDELMVYEATRSMPRMRAAG